MTWNRSQIRTWSIATLVAFVFPTTLIPSLALATPITVPVGTLVTVVFNVEVNPATATVGQTVSLSALNPVVIDGITVVQAGAPALAEVTASEENGAVGKPAKIGVALRHVTAVDGTNIPLTGQKVIEGENKQATSLVVTILCCVLGLLMKGGPATIPSGSQVVATTVAAATVNVP